MSVGSSGTPLFREDLDGRLFKDDFSTPTTFSTDVSMTTDEHANKKQAAVDKTKHEGLDLEHAPDPNDPEVQKLCKFLKVSPQQLLAMKGTMTANGNKKVASTVLPAGDGQEGTRSPSSVRRVSPTDDVGILCQNEGPIEGLLSSVHLSPNAIISKPRGVLL